MCAHTYVLSVSSFEFHSTTYFAVMRIYGNTRSTGTLKVSCDHLLRTSLHSRFSVSYVPADFSCGVWEIFAVKMMKIRCLFFFFLVWFGLVWV